MWFCLFCCFHTISPATLELETNERDSGRRAQLSQLNSLSMVSMSSSSDPSNRMMGLGQGELGQLPKDLQTVSKVKEVGTSSDDAFIFPHFPSKMTTVLLLFLSQSPSDWWVRVLMPLKYICSATPRKNPINEAAHVSTYGCLCDGATSFSKTSVVKKPREEDWERGVKGCVSSSQSCFRVKYICSISKMNLLGAGVWAKPRSSSCLRLLAQVAPLARSPPRRRAWRDTVRMFWCSSWPWPSLKPTLASQRPRHRLPRRSRSRGPRCDAPAGRNCSVRCVKWRGF